MQIFNLHPKIVHLHRYIAPEKSKTEYRELCEKSVEKWKRLKRNKVPDKEIQITLGISRATYYRRKKFLKDGIIKSKRPKTFRKSKFGDDIRKLILKIRTENQTYGKFKIAVIIKRDNKIEISESSVGRILKELNVPKSRSALRKKRKRVFNKHAKPFKFKLYKDMETGENVQIDHMTVTKNGVTVKHFAAWERHSRFIFANCYSNAKSSAAKKFLLELIKYIPYKIKSIQVDGGSEFMNEFEDACKELGILLYVLPPATPKYNGGVERSNRTFQDEFYNRNDLLEDSIVGIRRELYRYVEKYNTYRPHYSLKGMTPMEYINRCVLEANNLSHML
jgi:transposase